MDLSRLTLVYGKGMVSCLPMGANTNSVKRSKHYSHLQSLDSLPLDLTSAFVVCKQQWDVFHDTECPY